MPGDLEARYQALFETTLDGIMIVDDGGRYVDVNESLCRMLKTPREELIGTHFSQFIPPELLDEASTDFQELKSFGSFQGEFPLRARDGSLVELEWRSRANFLPGLHFCVARDITARKQAERELQRQQEELTDFVENATVGLHWVGPDGMILWANRAEMELLDYTREEYIGHNIAEFHVDAPVIEDILKRLAAHEELHSYEARLRCKDGSLRYVLISSNVRWDGDRFVHTRCFTRDITARRRAEAALQLHTRVLESMTEGVSVADENGIIRYTNPAEDQMFGYSPGELIGQPVTVQNNYAPEENARIVGAVIAQLKERGAWSGEWQNRKKDGTAFTTFAHITALEVEGECYFVCVQDDITERKRDEKRLATQHTITRLLVEAESVEAVAPHLLPPLCECLDAELGELWEVDEDVLRCTRAWARSPSPEIERLQATCRSLTLTPGEGLPGRVWEEPRATTIPELAGEKNFPRLALAQAAGLRSALAVPIMTAEEVFGVLEFFTRQPFTADAALLAMLTAIGNDIGLFISRRRAEQALATEQKRLRVTLTSIGDGVIVTDHDGAATFLNPVAESLTGWPSDAAAGRPLPEVFRIVNETTRRPVENPVERALRDGTIVGLANHTVLLARDGREHAIDDSAAPIRHDDGRVTGAVLVFRDIGERRRLEIAARRLAAIVESSDDAIASKDLNGIVTSWNEAAERIFGYTAEEMIGRPIARLIPPERPDEELAILERLRRGERVDHYETVRVRKDGTRLNISVTISPIRDADGHIVGASKVARDITKQKRLEQELRNRAEALTRADQAKDNFLAMLAHELRNPLAPIRNGLHLLRLQGENAVRRERVRELLERQVGHMTRMIDDLLDVSRITSGKIVLHREPLDLTHLVRLTVEDQRPALEQAGVSTTVALPGSPVWVLGDATRLTQVLDNLLENARKFTDRGGQVSIALSVDGAARQAVITVRDTGMGIEPEVLPHLFDVFAQADRTLERSRGGLGLGLALVKGLMQLHEGSVVAASPGVGQGAEFTLRLPLVQGPAPYSVLPTTDRGETIARRILIIEDNRDSADSLRDLLQLYGCQVTVAHTGPEGLELARRIQPEVIVCDIGLPGMDGYALARALRQQAELSHVLLLAMSGYGQEEDLKRSREAGFDGHLVKPVDPEELLRRFQQPEEES